MNLKINTSKMQLNDINIIRPIVIIFLIIVHSFTIYAGGWQLPQGIESVRGYFWIHKIAFSFMLEMFVFISGYLFSFHIFVLNKKNTLKKLIKSKFKRLITPSIVFSIIYYLLFLNKKINVFISIYEIISGVAHMWFLPMLFWCFIFTYLLFKIKLSDEIKLLLLLLLSIFSVIPIPFQISNSFYYLLFFYLGVYFCKNKDLIFDKFLNIKYIIIGACIFIIIFIPSTIFFEKIPDFNNNILFKILFFLQKNIFKISYSIVGLVVFYLLINFLLKLNRIKIPKHLEEINALCFGVYLYHQFILQYLFYKTTLPIMLGYYWLPIVSFFITLIFSLFLSKMTRFFKIGRFLIG